MKTDIHYINSKYPSIPDLRDKAKTKIPNADKDFGPPQPAPNPKT